MRPNMSAELSIQTFGVGLGLFFLCFPFVHLFLAFIDFGLDCFEFRVVFETKRSDDF